MPLTPQSIAKAVIREMVETNKKVDFATERMIEMWQDAFPIIRYIDDAEVVVAQQKARREKSSATRYPHGRS